MRARYKAFVGIMGAVVALMFGVACHTGGGAIDAGGNPKGAIVGNTVISQPSQATGPLGCVQVDLLNSQCEQATTWVQVNANTPTVIWSVGLSPQDVGNFTAKADMMTPGGLDNTAHAAFTTTWSLTLNQDASTMAAAEGGGGTVSVSQLGTAYAATDASTGAATIAFAQSGQQLQLIATSPVACAARALVAYGRSALQPWVLWVDAATLGSPVTTPTGVLVGTTPGHAAGASSLMLVGGGPFPCQTVSGNTSQALCFVQPGSYTLDAGAACLTATANPFCEQSGFTFTDSGPG